MVGLKILYFHFLAHTLQMAMYCIVGFLVVVSVVILSLVVVLVVVLVVSVSSVVVFEGLHCSCTYLARVASHVSACHGGES